MEKVITCADQAVEAGFCKSQLFEIVCALVRIQLGEFFFDLCRDDDSHSAFFGRSSLNRFGKIIPGTCGLFFYIADIEYRF